MAGAWATLVIKDGGGTNRTMRVWDESGALTGPFSFAHAPENPAASSTPSTVPLSETSGALLAANPAARGRAFQNVADQDAYVLEGVAGVTTALGGYSFLIRAGATFVMPDPMWQGAMTVIWAGPGSGGMNIVERT